MSDRAVVAIGMGTLAFVLVGTLILGASPALAVAAVAAAAGGVGLAVHRSHRLAGQRRRRMNDAGR
jgi:hypothetical protein